MAHVQHLRAQELPDLIERTQLEDVTVEVGHVRDREVGPHDGRAHRAARRGRRRRAVRRRKGRGGRVLRGQLGLERGPPRRVHHALHQVEPVHRVLGVDHRVVVRGRDARAREAIGQRRAADQDGKIDARGLQVARGHDHLLGRLDEQSGQPDHVRRVFLDRGDQRLWRDLDAEVHDREAVVRKDDVDQVLADVVHVALDGREQQLAARRAVGLGHELLEMADRGLHGLGALEHLGDDQLVRVEQPADLVHALHQRTVDDVERIGVGALELEVLDQAFLRALDDRARQPFIQRERAGVLLLARLRLAVARRELRDRIVAAIPQEVLGEVAVFLRDRGIALELLGVHDREVEPRLRAVIEEHGVEHLAAGFRQAEGHVRDAEDRLGLRERILDQPDAFDRLDRAADVLLVAGRARERERIPEDVLARDAVLLRHQLVRALRHRELAFARDGHALFLVLVDRAAHDRGAEPSRERQHGLEALFAVLEVDRVDDRLALRVGERALDHGRVGRVDHERRLDLPDQLGQERQHVGELVAIGIGEADVDHLRAALDLLSADLARLFPRAFADQPLEAPRADHVRALADQHGAVVVADLEEVDAGQDRPVMDRGDPRLLARDHPRERLGVLPRRAAAAAHDVEPAEVDESLEHARDPVGRLEVAALGIRQARVRDARDAGLRERRERADVVGHEFRPGRAVEPDREEVGVHDRRIERLDALAREHRAGCFNGARDHHRHPSLRERERVLGAEERGLDVAGVLLRLDQEEVDAALEQADHLFPERLAQPVERDAARDRDRLRGRPDRAGGEAGTLLRGRLVRGLGGELRRDAVEFPRPRFEPVLGEHDRRAAEGVGLDDVRARRQVLAVDRADDVGPALDQELVAAVELGPAEVVGGEVPGLDRGAHGAVDDEDALLEQRGNLVSAGFDLGHVLEAPKRAGDRVRTSGRSVA
jgi:hypothetical protein